MNIEKRYSSLQSEKQGKISGYVVLWDQESFVPQIGKKERFRKGSLKISESGVPLYFQHDKKNLLANTKSKTLTLKEDSKGLFFEASLPENAKLVRELCERKDVQGASLGFCATKQNFSSGVREIESAVIDEISLVSKPCHKGSVNFRSKERKTKNWSSLLWEY